ncbi:unnamed protein product [Ilex paraguariensis]|uniref:Uncharacterized protein n=1 Tax=Ilex paraguariensis TaxID=185542 RepID=A0ABC8UJ15_9AQUA
MICQPDRTVPSGQVLWLGRAGHSCVAYPSPSISTSALTLRACLILFRDIVRFHLEARSSLFPLFLAMICQPDRTVPSGQVLWLGRAGHSCVAYPSPSISTSALTLRACLILFRDIVR